MSVAARLPSEEFRCSSARSAETSGSPAGWRISFLACSGFSPTSTSSSLPPLKFRLVPASWFCQRTAVSDLESIVKISDGDSQFDFSRLARAGNRTPEPLRARQRLPAKNEAV